MEFFSFVSFNSFHSFFILFLIVRLLDRVGSEQRPGTRTGSGRLRRTRGLSTSSYVCFGVLVF
jgi:hypothetical protein